MLDKIDTSVITDAMIGGGAVAAFMALGVLAFVLLAGLYIYKSMAWMTIARKFKYKHAWLAWIPFADVAMVLQIGGFYWQWIFLLLIPIVGWLAIIVMFIIANWRIFEKLKYPGWLSLSIILPKVGGMLYLIVIGFVAWKSKIVQKAPARKVVKKKTAKKKVSKKKATRKRR